jgi:hypothetical protein
MNHIALLDDDEENEKNQFEVRLTPATCLPTSDEGICADSTRMCHLIRRAGR